jgi:hypothetical protein
LQKKKKTKVRKEIRKTESEGVGAKIKNGKQE